MVCISDFFNIKRICVAKSFNSKTHNHEFKNFHSQNFQTRNHAPQPPLPECIFNLPPRIWEARDQPRPGFLLRVLA